MVENNNIFATFKFIKRTISNEVILFAEDRNFFVSLSETDSRWGNDQNNINNKLSDGTFVKTPSVWKVRDKNKYFQKYDYNEWIEVENGTTTHRYDLVENRKENDSYQVILFSRKRLFYISLDDKHAKSGSNINAITGIFENGFWQF